jgi:GntR family transcriptional regulator, transcriptional repressor for pyruvate dehydrogenase complex
MLDRDTDLAEHLKRVRIKRPSDVIIEQISELITAGILKPGQRLPAERVLMQRFEVGRAHVREAIQKLELFGVVRTLPQSGSYIANISATMLERLVRGVLDIDDLTPPMLAEVRSVLEVLSAELAAERATPEQIAELRAAHDAQVTQATTGGDTLEEDIRFHIRLAEAANNVLLRSLIALIQPEVLRLSRQHATHKPGRIQETIKEHVRILQAIEGRDGKAAAAAMRHHVEMGRAQFQHS